MRNKTRRLWTAGQSDHPYCAWQVCVSKSEGRVQNGTEERSSRPRAILILRCLAASEFTVNAEYHLISRVKFQGSQHQLVARGGYSWAEVREFRKGEIGSDRSGVCTTA